MIEQLFHDVLDQPAPVRREHLLRQTSDPDLVAEVTSLLDAHQTGHSLLDSPPTTSLPEGTRLGAYELLSVIGSGGMGTVYLARRADRQYEKQVALKLVHSGMHETILGGPFERERQILATLDHPNIAHLIDAGLSPHGQPFLVMELVEGRTLNQWMEEQAPSLEVVLDLWARVADAVGHAHRNLILHCDLKPSNILVTAGGVPKLVDFGIARTLGGTNTATGTHRFTPCYASPEQIRGGAVTTATDIYSLGVLLCELASGQRPFPASADDPLAARALALPASLPQDLAAIIAMALREEPDRRYASAGQFAEDVDRFRRKLPVIAQPESLSYRAKKFIGRYRVAALATGLGALALLSVAAVATVQARRAQAQAQRAELVTQFLSSLMGIFPDGAMGKVLIDKGTSVRVLDLIDAAQTGVAARFAGQPEAEAEIRFILGTSFQRMGLNERAYSEAARAVELYRQLRPPTDRARQEATGLLASVDFQLGKFAEAEQAALEVKQYWRGDWPPAGIAILHMILGNIQLRLGKDAAAEQTQRDAISLLEAKLPGSPMLPTALSNLSLVYQQKGKFGEARPLLERAVALARRGTTASPESLAWAALNFASVERVLDHPASARAAAEESRNAFRSLGGLALVNSAQALATMAWAKARLGEPGAEADAREALAIQNQYLPKDHYDRAVSLTWLGYVLLQQKRIAEARPLVEQAIAVRRKAAPTQDWHTLPAAAFLGECMIQQGEKSAGLALLQQQAEALSRQFGPSNVRTLDAQARLARYQ